MRIIILFILLLSNSFAQISYGGIPRYYDRDISIDFIEPNRNNLVDRDFDPMVFQFGDEYQMDIDVMQITSPIYEEGIYTYTLGIKSQGAYGIGIIFDDFYLSDNSSLFIYDQDQTMFLGSFTSENNKASFIFPTSVAKGDHIIIELNVPEDEIDAVRLNIGTIIHDYEDIMGYFDDSPGSTREDCNINVACPEGDDFENEINGTIRVTMGGGLCSASIINNTLNDRTPYVLFADHCVSGSTSGYVFLFNYQASTCTGTSSSENQSVSGSTLLVSEDINQGADFALLEMTSTIPDSYNPFYVGWSRLSSSPQNVFGVHHPGAGIKKITQDGTNVNANGYYWEFQYNDGRVIPGSSGSPLFDEDKRQVGIASYIYTNYCDPSPDCYCDQQYTHGYGRFDLAMTAGVSDYLDPLNSGVNAINGISISGLSITHDPFEDMPFDDPNINQGSIDFSANVIAYTGVIEAVELYYNLGDSFIPIEMQEQGLGGYYSATLNGLYDGMIIEYYIQAVNSEGIIQTFPTNAPNNTVTFIIGDLPDLYFIDYEQGQGDWTIGDNSDDATAGIWELAEPVATYNDGGFQLQPGSDYTEDGTYCFITGNGYEEANGGFDDVDGGKTTLYSPTFNLEPFDEIIVTYWYWYTNNIGDNGNNDLWQVRVSNDNGITWQDINVTSNSTDGSWNKKRVILSNYTALTDNMQFQFIAEDLYYEGDAGSGGSLVEAALDDFLIEYMNSGTGIVGDVNNDESVDVIDIVIVVNMIVGSEPPNYATSDFNSDGEINIQDVILLINIVLDN